MPGPRDIAGINQYNYFYLKVQLDYKVARISKIITKIINKSLHSFDVTCHKRMYTKEQRIIFRKALIDLFIFLIYCEIKE